MIANLDQLLRQAAETFQDNIALVGRAGLRDAPWSYARLNQAVEGIAWQLRHDYGLLPGERILICGQTDPQLVAAYFGCFRAGLVVVPLEPHSSADFVARIAESTEAKAWLSNDDFLLSNSLPRISVAALAGQSAGKPGVEHVPQADDIAEIVFTSGTTGKPKGVVLSHRNIASSVMAIRDVYPKQRALRFLSMLPLSHMFEQTAGLFAPLSLGATIYFSGRFQSEVVMRKLEAKKIDGVIAVPQILDVILRGLEKRIAESGGQGRWRLWWRIAERLPFAWRRFCARQLFPAMAGTPQFFVSGGAPLPLALERYWELLGVRVIQGYGATECAPVISVNRFGDRIHGSVGWTPASVRVELSERDEILVWGDNVCRGYWRDEEATRLAFSADRGYRTGDLGEFGARGELYIKGRSKDMIVLANGLNVFPEDIEQVLAKQPDISACMVTDLPDRQGRQSIVAIFCFPDGMAESERQRRAQEAVRNANALLAPYQRIADVRFWPGDFPRTALMKVLRWKVKARFLAQQPDLQAIANAVDIGNDTASVEQLLAHVCRVEEQSISDGTDLVLDLGFDSLSRVELAGLIEERLGVICDDAELISIRNLGELKALLARSERSAKKIRFPAWPLSEAATAVRLGLQSIFVSPIHALMCSSFEVSGLEHLRRLKLPAMFIANHSSHVDTLSILRALPWTIRKRLFIAAAADYFFRNRLMAGLLGLAINAFPFSRDGSIRGSLEHCGELMDQGWSLLIYPEGTRSPAGRLLPFKTGIGYLATGLGVPVVPVAISGGHRILPKGARWPVRGPVLVSFGEALNVPSELDKQQATEWLHERLATLIARQELDFPKA